jgi:hypothetical protein
MIADQIKSIASEVGADLAPPLSGRELVTFKILQSGNVHVALADGTTYIIAARRHAGDDVLPCDIVTAENFIELLALDVELPIEGPVVGRRYFRRAATGTAGERCIHFSEAGRDV